MISGVVTLQNAGKNTRQKLQRRWRAFVYFGFSRHAKRERTRALFGTYCEKKNTDKTGFLLEYHKASVKNKHRGMRTFRTIKMHRMEMHLQFNDIWIRARPTQIDETTSDCIFSNNRIKRNHNCRNYITNEIYIEGIETGGGRGRTRFPHVK